MSLQNDSTQSKIQIVEMVLPDSKVIPFLIYTASQHYLPSSTPTLSAWIRSAQQSTSPLEAALLPPRK